MSVNAAGRGHSGNPMPSMPRHLACAETWAGNNQAASLVELPGLTAWVHSVPVGPSHAGGDVHYVSVCPSCIVSRIALADVSGHGEAVAVFGEKLGELMQRYLRDLEQIALMRDLNQGVREELGDGHYATMVAVGWHGRRGLVVMTNAGHPPPLWYRASRDEWSWLETQRPSERERPAGLPLGLLADVAYDRLVVKTQPGDLIVLYSDGVSEATSPAGNELGRDGLMNMARALDSSSAEALGTQLASALGDFRGDGEPLDDETIIVMRRNDM
jgi:phosphoserine phosphatase RsbU/P